MSSGEVLATERDPLLGQSASGEDARSISWEKFFLKCLLALVILIFLLCFYYVALLALGMPLGFSAGGTHSDYQPPLSSKDFNPDFSVGFNLGTSYGTVIVRYRNGTFVNVAKIMASMEYVAIMKRLSLAESRHFAPPYNDFGARWGDMRRQSWRNFWKQFGYPASTEASIFSLFIDQLRKETEKYLGMTIDSVVVTYPTLLALYREEIYDGLENSDLRTLELMRPLDLLQRPPHEVNAAYGGNGLGLCEHYLNATLCKEELASVPYKNTLAIIYTETALSAVLKWLSSPYDYSGMDNIQYGNFIDWETGLGSLPNFTNATTYWERVGELIATIPKRFWAHEIPRVILLGESAENQQFRRVLNDKLRNVLEDFPTIYSFDPLFVAARGAAEFGARIQDSILLREKDEA